MQEALSAYMLKGGMSNAGYNDIATGVGLKALIDKGYVVTSRESDYHSNGEDYLVCRLTNEAEKWLVNNQDKLKMRAEPKPSTDDKLPF